MRLTSIFLAAVGALALVALGLGRSPSEGTLELEFRDSMTGAAIAPEAVSLRRLDGPSARSFDGMPASRMAVRLEEGAYEARVSAIGYGAMAAQVSVSAVGNPLIRFQMDPLEVPPALSDRSLRTAHRPDAHLVAGCVVDETSGVPLEGVRVLGPGGVEAHTEPGGFFRLFVPSKGEPGVRFEAPGYASREHRRLEVWNGGDSVLRVRLRPGRGLDVVDERAGRHREGGAEPASPSDEGCDGCTATVSDAEAAPDPLDGPARAALPKFIRVGRNCASRTTCTTVEVLTLDSYCKRVLPAEWYACWGNVAGGLDSLKAGAVAVRSYGVSFVYAPATATYDICDTTSCQVMGNTTASNTNAGVDQTTAWVLLTASGSVARSEYSAENNDNGCGDGFAGTGSSWPCIADPVCAGFPDNGHGRGLCQWGSARWATGRRLSASQACTSSAPLHGFGTKNWQQILAHYYPAYLVATGGVATIGNVVANPSEVVVGNATTLEYSLNANNPILALILGASIAPAGTSNWSSHPQGDRRLDLPQGASVQPRVFAVASGQPWGPHDVWAALYHDRNNNFVIDAGDFVVDDGRFNGRLTVRSAITVGIAPTFAKVMLGKTRQFVATVGGTGNPAVVWSVASGPGSISSSGLFTASSTQGGVSEVRATSVADPTRWAGAKVVTPARIGF